MRRETGQPIQEEDLFAAALALPATERDSYLKRACSTNSGLLERLTCLLDAFGDAIAFISDGPGTEDCVTSQIGPYRLLKELGEGGCGVAYLADQAAPVKRQVALKIIKPGMDTRAVIARFEAERQVLALLDHPNVAKVFDAGATPQGRPYFVMELVRGIRITEYCDQSRLTVPERLSLFMQVCSAIQHAHHKGVIHRDIKPSNVLVTMHDGLPFVKVIDFGIAKATRGRLTDHTLHTEADQIIGTPAYISPEQAEPAHSAVDTRSDIYSLGVLLYELLTGHTPFDPHELAEASIEQLRERLRTEEPVRPSRLLTSLDRDELARISGCREAIAIRLIRQIREDLDWIVLQCLEKEPSRRYQAVNELLADLSRYLRHEPVLARPPTPLYTLRKLAHRNRIAFVTVLAAATFVLFITGFAITMTIQAQRIAVERDHAERERRRAEKVSNIVLEVFAAADPFRSLAKNVSGSALLDQAARSIQRELGDQPSVRARLLQAVGSAYLRRGEFKPSIAYLRDAIHVLLQVNGDEREALDAMLDLSSALRRSGDLPLARQTLNDAERLANGSKLQRSIEYARLLLNRGRVSLDESRISDALADFEASLHLYERVVGVQTVEVAEVLTELSAIHIWTDDLQQAERTAREAIRIFDITVPAMYPDRVTSEVRLAEALYLQNRLGEAAPILVDALRKNMELFGENSIEVVDVLDKLAILKYAQRRLDEAETYSRDAVRRALIVYGERNSLTANVAATLGRTLGERGKYSEAEATLREALDILSHTVPPDHQYIASTEYLLGEVLLAANRPQEAGAVLAASMNRWKRSGAPPWRAMRSASALGEALYRQGRMKQAKLYLLESCDALSADPDAEPAAKRKAHSRVARFLQGSTPPPDATL